LQSNQDYIRQVCTIALQQIKEQKLEKQNPETGIQSIIFGTQEGSLGQII